MSETPESIEVEMHQKTLILCRNVGREAVRALLDERRHLQQFSSPLLMLPDSAWRAMPDEVYMNIGRVALEHVELIVLRRLFMGVGEE